MIMKGEINKDQHCVVFYSFFEASLKWLLEELGLVFLCCLHFSGDDVREARLMSAHKLSRSIRKISKVNHDIKMTHFSFA